MDTTLHRQPGQSRHHHLSPVADAYEYSKSRSKIHSSLPLLLILYYSLLSFPLLTTTSLYPLLLSPSPAPLFSPWSTNDVPLFHQTVQILSYPILFLPYPTPPTPVILSPSPRVTHIKPPRNTPILPLQHNTKPNTLLHSLIINHPNPSNTQNED